MGVPSQMVMRHRSKAGKTKKIIQEWIGFCLWQKSAVCQYFLQIVKREVVTLCPLFLFAEGDPTALISGRQRIV